MSMVHSAAFPRPTRTPLIVTASLGLSALLGCGGGGGGSSTPPPAVAPAITSHPASQTVQRGATATFTVSATGTPTPVLQWRKGGTALGGQTSSTLALTNVQLTDEGTYDAVASNSAGSATSNPARLTVLLPGLVAYFPFSGNANDASGNNNNAVVQGAVPTADRLGAANSAYRTIPGYLQVPANASLNLTDFTFCLWFRMEQVNSAFNCLAGKDYTTAYAFGVNSGGSGNCPPPAGTLRRMVVYLGGVSRTFPTTNFLCDTWYHAALTYNNSTGALQLFVNGTLVDTASVPGGTLGTSTYPLGLGRDGRFGDTFNGVMDEIFIFNRVLTTQEIQGLYAR